MNKSKTHCCLSSLVFVALINTMPKKTILSSQSIISGSQGEDFTCMSVGVRGLASTVSFSICWVPSPQMQQLLMEKNQKEIAYVRSTDGLFLVSIP